MSVFVNVCSLGLPPIDRREVLRYMGAREVTEEVSSLLTACIEELGDALTCRVCWCEIDVRINGAELELGFAKLESEALSKNLKDCDAAILFAATVGLGIDRLISRYTHLSPVRALCFDAIGAERIEALCDAFCERMEEEYQKSGFGLRPRFSPGYGDLSLSLQRNIFEILKCPQKIGLSLNESLLMSPAKSVTAFIGLNRRD